MSNTSAHEMEPADVGTREVLIPGPSAYDLAVKHGFTGDEKEWLASLVGPSVVIYQEEIDTAAERYFSKYPIQFEVGVAELPAMEAREDHYGYEIVVSFGGTFPARDYNVKLRAVSGTQVLPLNFNEATRTENSITLVVWAKYEETPAGLLFVDAYRVG